MIHCPDCGSIDIDRIGLYEYQCNDCGDVFDANEIKKGEDDDEWYPDNDSEDEDDEDQDYS